MIRNKNHFHKLWTYCLDTLLLLSISASATTAIAQSTAKSPETSTMLATNPAWEEFSKLRRQYRSGELNDTGMWSAIVGLSTESLSPHQQAAILQIQATLMQNDGQPILAAIYASQALRDAKNPLSDDFHRCWQILRDVSKDKPIQNILELVATNVNMGDESVPVFGSDWNYFIANALVKAKQPEKALTSYKKVRHGDRYFYPAKYQQAMLELDQGHKEAALSDLDQIVAMNGNPGSKIKKDEYDAMLDHSHMAMGRILYEQKKFTDAVKHYRAVRRDGSQFYDSLFEQSWALFLAGYPNHALGMLYGVRSPFFKDTFNPEATMLAAIIYYWMCRYDDARVELADFVRHHQKTMDAVDSYLARGMNNPKTYYQLFEDTVTGVSSDSLSIPREVLVMVSQQDNLLYVRDQYAALVRDMQRLEKKGLYGSRDKLEGPHAYLEQWAESLRNDIGVRLHTELVAVKSDFERLYDQGQFLYVELLMSKKDQLLGKELHGDSKLSQLTSKDEIRDWGKKTQYWAGDDKQEYWADELGYHIYKLEPLCVVRGKQE